MKRKLLALVIANLLAAPAFAQDATFGGSVSVGGMRVDDGDAVDASKLNEYRDLDSGLMTMFDIRGRGARYWFDAFGENLGRDDMYVTARGGTYDVFKYRLYSDQLKHNFLFGGRTPYANAGSALQTATFPRLDPATWNGIDVGYKRRDTGGFFELQVLNPWYFRADANQVAWSGSKMGSSSQGLSPGNGMVELALPVDYTTRNTVLEAGYNGKTIHGALSWMASKFENDNESIQWTNGFFANGLDTTYLGADNKYSRLAGNLTFRGLPMGSTLALRFTKDKLESSPPLISTVLNTAGAIAQTGLSGTFEGEVENETFTVAWASAPVRNLDLRVYGNYYKREDNSPHITFSSTALGTFVNEPFSYDKKNYGVEAHYRISRGNRVGAGFDYLDVERERFDFDRSKDKRFTLEYKNTMLDNLAARVKFTRLERDSNFLLANDGANANDVRFWNRFLQAFDAAPLDQNQWKATLDFTPVENLDLSLEAIHKKNDYRSQVLGRLGDDRREVYASATFGAIGTPRLTVFADIEEVEYDSRHRVVGTATAPGAYDPNTAPTATNYNWEGTVKDRNWAYGVAVEWPVMARLMLKLSAMHYKADGSVDFVSQTSVTSPTYPVPLSLYDDSKRTSLNLRAIYTLNKSWTITGGYAYEKFEHQDASYDGFRYTIPAASRADSYYTGFFANPEYKANIVYGLVTYRF